MTYFDIHFVDPTIPGISGRDLTRLGCAYRSGRKDFALRKGLSGLNREQLRDLGLDRDTA